MIAHPPPESPVHSLLLESHLISSGGRAVDAFHLHVPGGVARSVEGLGLPAVILIECMRSHMLVVAVYSPYELIVRSGRECDLQTAGMRFELEPAHVVVACSDQTLPVCALRPDLGAVCRRQRSMWR